MYLILRGKHKQARLETQIGTHTVRFAREALADGSVAMLATVEDDSDVLALVRKSYASVYDITDRDPRTARAVSVRAPVVLATEEAEATQYPPTIALAMRNGWAYEDLTGTGVGDDFGPGGGTSVRSGLTASQMALCRPPTNWEAEAATKYPWEMMGWRPPGVDFTPPAGTKERPVVEVADVILADDSAAHEVDAEDTAPVIDEDAPVERRAAEKETVDAEKALATIDENIRERMIVVLCDSWRASGKPPTRSKINSFLKREGLPTVTEDQLAALIELAPAI